MSFANAPYALVSMTPEYLRDVLFYIGRHGTTEFNQDDMFRGDANPKLNEKGRQDAKELADFLKDFKIREIVCSDYHRSVETASIIGKKLGMIPEEDPRLESWHLGIVSGMSEESEARKIVDYYIAHPDEEIPDGESLNYFRSRVRPVFSEEEQETEETGIPSLIVAHHSVIREIAKEVGQNPEEDLVKPGGLVAVVKRRNGAFRVIPIFKQEPNYFEPVS